MGSAASALPWTHDSGLGDGSGVGSAVCKVTSDTTGRAVVAPAPFARFFSAWRREIVRVLLLFSMVRIAWNFLGTLVSDNLSRKSNRLLSRKLFRKESAPMIYMIYKDHGAGNPKIEVLKHWLHKEGHFPPPLFSFKGSRIVATGGRPGRDDSRCSGRDRFRRSGADLIPPRDYHRAKGAKGDFQDETGLVQCFATPDLRTAVARRCLTIPGLVMGQSPKVPGEQPKSAEVL